MLTLNLRERLRARFGLTTLTAVAGIAPGLLHGDEQVNFVLQDKLERPEPFAESHLQLNASSLCRLAEPGIKTDEVEWSQDCAFKEKITATSPQLFLRPLTPMIFLVASTAYSTPHDAWRSTRPNNDCWFEANEAKPWSRCHSSRGFSSDRMMSTLLTGRFVFMKPAGA